jgi:hypothetical protein
MRKLLLAASLLTTFLIVVSLTPLRSANAATPTLRFISDITELGPVHAIGRTFEVAVVAEHFSNLYGFDIQINWTTDYTHNTEHVFTVPAESYPLPNPPSPYGGILHSPWIPVKQVVNESKNIPGAEPDTMAWFVAASMVPAPLFNGNGTVGILRFNVTDQPFFPQNATLRFHFVAATLADNLGGPPIPHTEVDLEIPLYGRVPPNIKITGVQPHPIVVGYGGTLYVDVNVTNEGSFPLTVNITLYANTTDLVTEAVTIGANNSTTAMINATVTIAGGLDLANYTIWVYAWPTLGETNTTDNMFIDGMITVKFIGDIDGDRDVDILDVVQITSIYGARRGQPQYNPKCDLDDDGAVTILDVVTCVFHYGQKYP